MSRWGKRKKDYDGESNRNAKFSKNDSSDGLDDTVVCELSKNRRVSVRIFSGKIWVDIREFYEKDGKQLPGKKGISLNLEQWNILRDHAEEIDEAVADNS